MSDCQREKNSISSNWNLATKVFLWSTNKLQISETDTTGSSCKACFKKSPKKSITFEPVLSPADHSPTQPCDKWIKIYHRNHAFWNLWYHILLVPNKENLDLECCHQIIFVHRQKPWSPGHYSILNPCLKDSDFKSALWNDEKLEGEKLRPTFL